MASGDDFKGGSPWGSPPGGRNGSGRGGQKPPNFDEVVEKAYNQVAGLAAYVCTGSIELANKTSEALETGMVAVNTPFISSAETPFGGIKQSGYGREGGSMGIKDYLNIKYAHLGIVI